MTSPAARTFETPGEGDLGLLRVASRSGLSASVLPNGCVFAIEHRHERGRTLINQVPGSPLDGGIARLFLRVRCPRAGGRGGGRPRRAGHVRRRPRPLRLGGRDRRRAAPRLALAAPASGCSGSGASRSPTPRPSSALVRRDPRAGSSAWAIAAS